MKPGINYGYAGPICYCPVNPTTQYRRPASREVLPQSESYESFRKETDEIIMKLQAKLVIAIKALNYIGILQMGELDYTNDFFELTKTKVRETLEKIK